MIEKISKTGEPGGPGKRLIMVRHQFSLKQRQLSENPGLSSGYLSDIEDRDKGKNKRNNNKLR